MLLSVVSIIANTIYYIILNIRLYTDEAAMPDGTIKKWHHSPAARLAIADQSALFRKVNIYKTWLYLHEDPACRRIPNL